MCSTNHFYVIGLIKLCYYVWTEQISEKNFGYFSENFTIKQLVCQDYPAPLGLTPHPCVSSGSDHKRSHMGPSCGTSCFRSMVRIWSKVWMLGERPPCTQNICKKMSNNKSPNKNSFLQWEKILRNLTFPSIMAERLK